MLLARAWWSSLLTLGLACAPAARPAAVTPAIVPAATVSLSGAPRSVPSAYPHPVPAPWQRPATKLSSSVLDALESLFELGLGDPRLGTYREVEVAVGEPWTGGGARVNVHGWLLPREPGAARDFAVLWNGLVHAVVDRGPADLDADLDAFLKAQNQARIEHEKRSPGFPYRPQASASEGGDVAGHSLSLVRSALLLRAGRVELAERVAALAAGEGREDAFLRAADDLLWARFDRGVTAHMRGDDELAYESVHQLAEAGKRAEALCAARTVEPRDDRSAEFRHFGYLRDARVLEEDSVRRLQSSKREPFDPERLAKLSADARIGDLVARLDEVAERQWSQPGGVGFGQSLIVAALVAEGHAVVAPLLQVLEHDERLTRSVEFHRDFHRSRSLMGVHEVAYTVLASVLQYSFSEAQSGDNPSDRDPKVRAKIARALRAFDQRWTGMPNEERWYARLQDPKATPTIWLEAARQITSPIDQPTLRGSSFSSWSRVTALPAGRLPKTQAESLRTKTPNVADLIEARADDAWAIDRQLSCLLTLAAAEWEPSSDRTRKALAHRMELAVQPYTPGSMPASMDNVVELAEARLAAGDPTVAHDYAEWLLQLKPGSDSSSHRPFGFLAQRPEDADLQRVASAIFAPTSPWQPFVGTSKKVRSFGMYVSELFQLTALLQVPAYRSLVSRLLKDSTVAGILKANDGHYSYDGRDGSASSVGAQHEDHDDSKASYGTMPIRVADFVASALADGIERSHGSGPKFRLFWPKARRDAALPAMRQWAANGGR